MIKRILATLAATATFAAVLATPAAASPEDGQGCVGTPTIPGTYVCVISLTPAGALPTTTASSIPVAVPPLCYFLDCTDPTTVNVPVPGLAPGSGVIAVLWYQGQYIPIAAGTGTLLPLVNEIVVTGTQAADTVVATVGDVLNGLPTTKELEGLLVSTTCDAFATATWRVNHWVWVVERELGIGLVLPIEYDGEDVCA